VLHDILKSAQNSEFGRKMGFSDIKTVDDFRNKVPISDYSQIEEELTPFKAGQETFFLTVQQPVLCY
jgi:hypothetical protein